MPPNDAANAARGLTGIIAAKFGGKVLYVPKATQIKTEERHAEIWRQYQAGTGFEELATNSGLSERQVRSIVTTYSSKNRTGAVAGKLSLLNKRILEVAANCREDPEVHALLEMAVNNVSQAHKKIAAHQN